MRSRTAESAVVRRRRAVVAGLAMAAAALACILPLGGCTSVVRGTTATVASTDRTPAVALPFAATHVYAGRTPAGAPSIVATDIDPDALQSASPPDGQLLQIDLLWAPKAGETPMDPTATNIRIRHVVVSGGRIGVYRGAGFGRTSGSIERGAFGIRVLDASLALGHASDDLRDALGAARLEGRIGGDVDLDAHRRLARAIDRFEAMLPKR